MDMDFPEARTHDYVRHGTPSLFAALNIATGEVIGACHRRHRHQEFLKFLKRVETEVPGDLEVHLILDNYATHKTPKVQRRLAKRPRWHIHFTPTGASWLNMVERFVGVPAASLGPVRFQVFGAGSCGMVPSGSRAARAALGQGGGCVVSRTMTFW